MNIDGESVGEGRRWFVAQSAPGKESYAAANLANQGFQAFVPRIRRSVRHARRVQTKLTPLFPRYLFVALDLSRDRWRSVRGTYGVTQVVMAGERPLPAPRGVVEELIAATEAAGGLSFRDRLRPGERVRFREGPFSDLVGRLVAMDAADRVTVLLEMLGAERLVAANPDLLMPVGD